MKFRKSAVAVVVMTALLGCSEDNLDIGEDNNIYPPRATEVSIPALNVGETAEGLYTYFDPNPTARPEGDTKYSWVNQNQEVLSSERSLLLLNEYEGQTVNFCVIPVAQGTVNKVGEEQCSNTRVVNPPLGERPEASNVVIDKMSPAIGDTLTGSYDYFHPEDTPEGNSDIEWQADLQAIAGETKSTLLLTAANSENKSIRFCVTPKTQQNVPIIGDRVCSEATNLIEPVLGSAPEARNVKALGEPFVGAVVTGSYDFYDEDRDLEGASTFQWKRDNTEIQGAENKQYRVLDTDDGTRLSFCVTPVSATGLPTTGNETCAPMDEDISIKIETPPTASGVGFTGLQEVGQTIVGQYTYHQLEDAPEGNSTAYWQVGGIKQDTCSSATNCELTVTKEHLGNSLSFCVEPKTLLGTPSDTSFCSPNTDAMGIKLTGTLEYDKDLIAIVYGYKESASTGDWIVAIDNQSGPSGDGVGTVQHTGNIYTIGVRDDVTDSNGNGVIDDYDWLTVGGQSVDARNFIGKDVKYCLSTEYGERCAFGAEEEGVTGGLYFDSNDATKRGIEPIRVMEIGALAYHRPLTVAETQLKDQAKMGALIPNAHEADIINGIEWALFNHIGLDTNPEIVKSCRNLYAESGDWYLPMGTRSTSYDNNFYENSGNAGVPEFTNNVDAMVVLTSEMVSSNGEPGYQMGPVTGWPVSTSDNAGIERRIYTNATRRNQPEHAQHGNFYALRFYAGPTGNTQTSTIETGGYVSCVKVR
ncbi:hypothetical protein [Vibrio hangzhouensis]|uniref:Uncharacterized protein n=1 Tax=Vibrio hangzhouensis TaxID=462991 RepID=A0A1H6B7J6_9VIBR|nr:hypothetical protein [Vibrio hangzhouensis]SEG56819.1 hypothetical protein SAMN04488244_12025 [Vibrio hangzhouensis]